MRSPDNGMGPTRNVQPINRGLIVSLAAAILLTVGVGHGAEASEPFIIISYLIGAVVAGLAWSWDFHWKQVAWTIGVLLVTSHLINRWYAVSVEEAAMDLTDEQWAVLDPLMGEMPRRADGRGRPWRSSREVLNGILWILRTGAQWADLPGRYPPYQTCHRRYQRWVREGVFERILEALATDLKERGKLDLSECFIDGTFIVAKKGVDAWVRPSGGKGRSSWPDGRWQTAVVYRSPYVPPQLRLTRAVSSLPLSTPAS